LRFLVDAQLPPALATALVELGHEATHVVELGLESATDMQIWNRATRSKSVLLTKDQDFAAMRRRLSAGPSVIWLRIGNATNEALSRLLLPRLPEIVAAIGSGERLIEIL